MRGPHTLRRVFSRTIEPLSSVDRAAALAFGLFAILTTTLVAAHQPWRDEADAWLMARDASLGALFQYAGYSGTPALWYLIQAPFAKAGAVYATQRYLHLAISLAAVGLLLFRAPFPLPLRLALVFGYYFSFEYTVVARNYTIGILCCFAALAMDRQRLRWAPAYGFAIGLAANASAHFTFFAAALMVPFLWDAWTHRAEPRLWLGVVLGTAGVMCAVWQLWPRAGGQLPPHIFAHFQPEYFRDMLPQAFAPGFNARWAQVGGLLGAILVAARLWFAPRAAVVLTLTTIALIYIFVFKYIGGSRHFGLLVVAMVLASWMAEGESKSAARAPLRLRRAVGIGLLVLLLPSMVIAVRSWRSELQYPFSEAGDMARFIIDNDLERAWIAGHPAPQAESVLAFLPPRMFWYPSLAQSGSHMEWDARFAASIGMSVDEAVVRMKAQRSNWADPQDPALVLVSTPLSDPAAEGYRLLYRTSGRSWFVPSEVYYLYAPVTDARLAAGR
jgi:hypothetical protein